MSTSSPLLHALRRDSQYPTSLILIVSFNPVVPFDLFAKFDDRHLEILPKCQLNRRPKPQHSDISVRQRPTMKIFQLVALIEQLLLPRIRRCICYGPTFQHNFDRPLLSIEIRLQENTRVSVFVCLFVGSSPSCPHTFRWARYHVAHLPRPPSVVFHRAASAFVQTRREADAPHCSAACVFSGR